jgi:MFS family permease
LRRLIPFFAANALFASGLGFHSFLYNFYLDGLRLSPEIMGRAAATWSLGGLLVLVPAGRSVDRWGPKAVIVGAAFCAAIGLAWSAIATSAPTIYAASALAGAAGVSWRVAQAPVLMELSTTGNRSRLFTLDVAFLVGSGAAATALSGALVGRIEQWRHVGHETALTIVLVVGAVVTGLSAIVYSTLDLPSAAPKTERRGVAALVIPPSAILLSR